MPNWVRNVVKMEGIAELPLFTTEYDEYEKKDITNFDFEKLIPMPESLNIQSGSCVDEAIVYYVTDRCTLFLSEIGDAYKELIRKQITNPVSGLSWSGEVFKRALERAHNAKKKDKDEFYKSGATYVSNILNYGAATWYEWRIARWGTKWNATMCKIEENQISFTTAWSNPEPILEKLAEMYPDAHIEHTWADEDMGNNSGYREYIDGTWYGDYDETEQEAYGHYVECWGETDCLYQDSTGTWFRRSCDECHACD